MMEKMKTIAAKSATPRRILYVEDDIDSREMLALTLRNVGYEIKTATSMTGALSLAKLEPFDLYILENRFVDGSGVELCRKIRAFDSLTPIIFYSSSAYPADIEAGIAAGAQNYLTKPLGIYTIIQTVAELFAKMKPVQAQARSRIFTLPQKLVQAFFSFKTSGALLK
jgi:DNA-binding response OmpR family regulator